MFRVLDVHADGIVRTTEGAEMVAPPPEGTLRWIDLREQDATQLELLRERFDFHPLAIEDCMHLDQRPKLEEYRDHLFVVIQTFAAASDDPCDLELLELHAFLGEGYLVTVHARPIQALDMLWQRTESHGAGMQRGMPFVLYQMCDSLVDLNFPVLDALEASTESLEERVMAAPTREDLQQLYAVRRALVFMRRVLTPQRDVFLMLARHGHPLVGERTAPYFRDVYDHLARTHAAVEAQRELVASAIDAHRSMLSSRTNEIMKRLTVLSAVFLPLTFITGFFGQNFEHMPFDSDTLMYIMLAACVAIPTGMLLWFYRSRWI